MRKIDDDTNFRKTALERVSGTQARAIASFLHFLGGTSQPTQHWLHSFYGKEDPGIVFFQDNLIKAQKVFLLK